MILKKSQFVKLTDSSDVNSEESCILDDVDTDAVQAYIDLITDKNDPVERLIEESEKIGRELAECKKEKESLMHKVAGLEELNKELCKNLKEKNKSFMLNYPSDSFRFPLSPEEKEKVKTQMLDFSIPFDHEYKIDLTHNILIQKYLKNRNLSKLTENYLLQRKGDNILNPTVRSKIIFGVACTMKQLHARNVFHRNVKLQDIFLDENHEPKIASFYLAKFLNSPKEDKKDVGTPFSMAPETFATDNEYEAFPVDVYSYAFFLYMMFSPVLPNSSTSSFILKRKVMDGGLKNQK